MTPAPGRRWEFDLLCCVCFWLTTTFVVVPAHRRLVCQSTRSRPGTGIQTQHEHVWSKADSDVDNKGRLESEGSHKRAIAHRQAPRALCPLKQRATIFLRRVQTQIHQKVLQVRGCPCGMCCRLFFFFLIFSGFIFLSPSQCEHTCIGFGLATGITTSTWRKTLNFSTQII